MNAQPTVMIVSAEFWPLAKTGGLADMVRSIATSLRDHGFQVRVLLPGYRSALSALPSHGHDGGTLLALGHKVNLVVHQLDGLEIIIAHCDPLFDRPGNAYSQEDGKPWTDNAKRFAVLCKAAASIVNGTTPISRPDLVHIQDWHAGLTPAYFDPWVNIPVVLTVHNFMFQGRFPNEVIVDLELNHERELLSVSELFGGFSFLQAGLALSTTVTTTSKSYIEEIGQRNRHNWYYLKDADLARLGAITNWPEFDVWNPVSDPVIAAKYDERSIDRRVMNKRDLERRLGWKECAAPILCTLGRITRAKGFKFLLKQVEELLGKGCRVVFVGDGDRPLLNAARNLAQAHSDSVALVTPYSEEEARRILSGADMLLMPSLTEPCGLSQQHAQIYGCVPIVSRVGGIPDSVSEGQTGFLFEPSDRASFLAAIDRALHVLRGPNWADVQRNCMLAHANSPSRGRYADLFHELIWRTKEQQLSVSGRQSRPHTLVG